MNMDKYSKLNYNYISNELESFKDLFKDDNYLFEFYEINDKIELTQNHSKMYGISKDNYKKVVISQEEVEFDEVIIERLSKLIVCIEENIILVENVWLNEVPEINKQIIKPKIRIFISEFTKEVYRTDFGIANLSFYNKKTVFNEGSLILAKNIILVLNKIHRKKLAHLNLKSSSVYYNINTNDVYLSPIKLSYEFDNDFYTSPELCFAKLNNDNFDLSLSNDIWSIGCILAEIFFIKTPLFQSFSLRDKIKKIFEILGFPEYKDVSSYISRNDYLNLKQSYRNREQPLINEILNYEQLRRSNDLLRKEIYSIVLKGLNFNPDKRPSMKEILYLLNEIEVRLNEYNEEEDLNTSLNKYSNRAEFYISNNYKNSNLSENSINTKRKQINKVTHNEDYNQLNLQLDDLMNYLKRLENETI